MSSTYPHIQLELAAGKKVFFASDFHLGAPDAGKSRGREKKIVQWLQEIRPETGVLFLVGDLFDFWFEYKHVIPKGFSRFLAEVSKFSDDNIPVYVFTGNHDIWMFDYLKEETGVNILYHPAIFEIQGQRFFVGHGDGLGPGDNKFKFLKKVFTFPLFQKMFSWLHPDIGIGVAQVWSAHSRTHPEDEIFMGEENERLIVFAKEQLATHPAQYYIFGHRHLPLDLPVGQGARYINLGDWIYNFTYLEYDGTHVELKKYPK